MKQFNAAPFTIAGFARDVSGAVILFRGGALKPLKAACATVTLDALVIDFIACGRVSPAVIVPPER